MKEKTIGTKIRGLSKGFLDKGGREFDCKGKVCSWNYTRREI